MTVPRNKFGERLGAIFNRPSGGQQREMNSRLRPQNARVWLKP